MRSRPLRLGVLALALAALAATGAFAQGIPTATLTGRVVSDGQGLPGVTVTAKSPALQGGRTSVTAASGDYILANLPPGEYAISFELSGFATIHRAIRLASNQNATIDVPMTLSTVTTSTTVTASTDAISTEAQASTTFTADVMRQLPVTRTLAAAVVLSPGVNTNGPKGTGARDGNIVISGAQSFENLFLVNGVVVNENLRGQPLDLFIEDSIQETTTTTSSVSAEYGRFTGGVVNAITKSGGNSFSGSVRVSLANDDWAAKSPSKETLVDKTNPRYEATLGGPLWKDRVWIFGAARLRDEKTTGQTSFTLLPFEAGRDEKRFEGKLTLTPFTNHTLTGSYLNIQDEQTNNFFGEAMDYASLYDRKTPQSLLAVNYNGVLSSNFFVEGQYSNRRFTFEGSGSKYTDLIQGTLLLDRSRSGPGGFGRYNSPTFCGVCDPEKRDNENIVVKGTYFLSSPTIGAHSIVVGYDNFSGQRKANNYQSGSNYRIYGTRSIFQNGEIFPVFDRSTYVFYQPIEFLSKGSDVRTHSVFLNDNWRVTDRLSVNLGLRWDKNDAKDQRGVVTADDSALSPRVSATFDAAGNGALRVSASYAKYVAGLQQNAADGASNAGNSSTFYWYYDGPGATPINTNANGPLVPAHQAIQQFFDWFFSKGCPNLATCQVPLGGPPSLPGLNRQIQQSLKSPHANEYVVGVGGTLGANLAYRVDAVRREFADFYVTRIDTSTGKVSNPLAPSQRFDLGLIENDDAGFLEREYTGLHTSIAWRALPTLRVNANWTWSHTLGNFDGENATSGQLNGTPVFYPEFYDRAWGASGTTGGGPRGDLATDQRHRVRLFAAWDAPMPSFLGRWNLSAIHSVDTGTPYGAVGTVNTRPFVTNPGYISRPASVTYYFTARDAFRNDTINRTDLALNWAMNIGPVELFVQPQVLNAFNNQGVIGVATGVETAVNRSADYATFNPFSDTPRQGARGTGANWNTAPTFGQPRNKDDYQLPRVFRVSMGLRF